MVIIASIWAYVVLVRIKHQGTQGAADPMLGRGQEQQLQHEVEQLRERIKVLERIATEDRETKRLSAEIERLRGE
jgi:hypothetical protein